ncbi:MAG: tRNA (cytosine(32)/uridine(32)-2'-O)-methyltransferase TrmJ [Gammaproteobacteria bacterium]|nr:tRNA (cytosine(32)/uridine(32)-2'-O)-methyltransferase TrmJ [Gammaproteobacteria bacterium]|tara:strand:+ start:7190 stop:7906 length:717 start_codon:yes stop_codon:yes gene_type:complete
MNIRIVLVGTTHPGNIGAVARAMKNMGLTDLALVNPKFFPHEEATVRASGADDVLDSAATYFSLNEAISDCNYVVGASARSRSLSWPSMVPRDCAERMILESKKGRVAAIFGPENNGLNNDDLDLCHTLITIPTNPDFKSLNLAMAVQVLTYELRIASNIEVSSGFASKVLPATADEMKLFYDHLEQTMIDVKFLNDDNPRFLMRRLRRLFIRAHPDKNEINILRGFLAAINRKKELK